MSKVLPNGIGESLGDPLVVNSPLFVSGAVWYVDSENANGDDDVGYGVMKQKPFLTLAYAVSAASDGDTVVLLDGHNEQLALSGATVNIDKRLIVVGSGESEGEPTVVLTAGSGSGTSLIALAAEGCELRNIKFAAFEVADGADQVNVLQPNCRIIGCVFEANENHSGVSLDVGSAAPLLVRDCVFRSTATDPGDQPDQGIRLNSAGLYWLEDVEFDAGSVGWATGALVTAVAVQLVAEGITMLNAQVRITESGAQTHWCAPIQTGGAQIQEV